MMKNGNDPFDVPPAIIPPAVTYQWCAKSQLGEIDPNYQMMLQAGWSPVPRERHAEYFGKEYAGQSGTIEHGGQVLLERPRTDAHAAREREMDAACINAGQGRTVDVILTVRVRTSFEQLHTAQHLNLTASQYVARRIQMIADESEPMFLAGSGGALVFVPPCEPTPRPRFWWLRPIFDLISTIED